MSERNDGGRPERLKAALRDNLRRRKAQGRGRTASEETPTPEDEPPKQPRDDGEPRPLSDKTRL